MQLQGSFVDILHRNPKELNTAAPAVTYYCNLCKSKSSDLAIKKTIFGPAA